MLEGWLVVLVCVVGVTWGGFPSVLPTVGQVWPRPQVMDSLDSYMVITPDTFHFSIVGYDCDILQEALTRYLSIMFTSPGVPMAEGSRPWREDPGFRGYLENVEIDLQSPCEDRPYLDMDESYQIKVGSLAGSGEGIITSESVWGLLRGLETFSQLLVPEASAYTIRSTEIRDFPRFTYRGLMLDTGRHYLPVRKIQETLDLMAMNKFNVFHWHIVDDQSFPYVSAAFPNLSKFGAYSFRHVYTADEVATVVEYARLRGIRVLPEFDTPDHTLSWGPGQPGLLTPCYSDSVPDGTFGAVDPTREDNYDFLETLFTEVTARFSDRYVHLGGNKVNLACWKSNPDIEEFMVEHDIEGDYRGLEDLYFQRLFEIIENLPTEKGYLVWQDLFDRDVDLPIEAIIHTRKHRDDPEEWQNDLFQFTAEGYHVIFSSCWMLNRIKFGTEWYEYYECDPRDFDGTDRQKQLVLGGEACLWGDYLDVANLTPRTWPWAAVVAEKLWSSGDHTGSAKEAAPRLEEHRCRLVARGYDVEPVGPSFCSADVD